MGKPHLVFVEGTSEMLTSGLADKKTWSLQNSTEPVYLAGGEAAVWLCVLTKTLIFLSIWFDCNERRDAPSVTVMGSAMRSPHPVNMTQCDFNAVFSDT